MGQGNFERKWQQAFQEAKMEPSKKVWTGIEAAIANGEAAKYKRRAFFYKWMAAAGILLFAGLLGYLSYQSVAPSDTDAVTDWSREQGTVPQPEPSESAKTGRETPQILELESREADDPETSQSAVASKQLPGLQSEEAANAVNQSKQSLTEAGAATLTVGPDRKAEREVHEQETSPANRHQATIKALAGRDDERSTADSQEFIQTSEDKILPKLTDTKLQAAPISSEQRLPLVKSRNRNPSEETLALLAAPSHLYGVALRATPSSQMEEEGGLWAGISLTPGQFDPNYRQGNEQALSASALDQSTGNSFTPSEESSSGFSFSVALDVGMKLSSRWEITGGLQYFRNNVQSRTNAVLGQTPVFSSVVESLDLRNSSGNLEFSPTDLDNDFQFISIPLQAGYLILDKKVQLTVNAGLAADIFLKNTISPADASLESITINPGTNSPYRTLYFNGLVGLQASYEILPRYSITLQPQYKIAINEFTKRDNSYTSLPASVGVGVGIKYNFK